MPRLPIAKTLVLTAALACPLAIAPAGLAQQQKAEGPEANPFLELSRPMTWDFRREINISPSTFTDRGPGGSRRSFTDRIILQEITIVAPMITGCATAITDPEDLTEGVVKVDHEIVAEEPTIVPGFANGEQLARWDLQSVDTRRLTVALRGPATTFESRVKEDLAMRVPWPEDGYPETIATSLEPEQFIESDDPRVIRLMKKWTSNNPQGPNPYLVAKALAGQVLENFQPSGPDFRFDNTTRFAGIDAAGAARAARSMRGSEADMASLLCAVYRAAGLPARVVVGLDVAGSPGGRSNVPAPSAVCRANHDPDIITFPLLRTWVEFYLFDEASGQGGWIPVDIRMLRLASSRMQQLDRVWDGFGGGMCYDHLVPIAFSLVPPLTAGDDQPASVWGWITTPADCSTETELIIEATPQVNRGGRR